MKEHRVTSYSRGGRRFARVPGDEKLAISRSSGDASQNADDEVPEPPEHDFDTDASGEVLEEGVDA